MKATHRHREQNNKTKPARSGVAHRGTRVGKAPRASRTHHHPQGHGARTVNSQLPHGLIVSAEKDSHGDQGIIAVSAAESLEVGKEVGPLQEGLWGRHGERRG